MRYTEPFKYNFCPFCGGKLSSTIEENKVRNFCVECKWTYYPHSATSACAIIIKGRKVLLVKRNREPYKDTWMFPSGYLNFGELPEDGLKREVLEETGLEVKSLKLLKNVLVQDDFREPNHLAFFYRVVVKDGELDMSHDPEENSEINWFEIKNPPKIGWEGHKEMMKSLQKSYLK